MTHGPMSPEERRRVRLVRLAVYGVPPVVGLLTFPTVAAVLKLGTPNNGLAETAMVVMFWGNLSLAAASAAYAVARVHPVRRGAWWRAGAAFVFAFAAALGVFIGTQLFAASLGYHL